MDDAQFARLHSRIDILLSQLAVVSERIARIEAQEEGHRSNTEMFWRQRWPEQTKRVDRLYEKIEALEDKQAADHQALMEKLAAESKDLSRLIHSTLQPESRLKRGAKGTGLVAASGFLAALLKALWDVFAQ